MENIDLSEIKSISIDKETESILHGCILKQKALEAFNRIKAYCNSSNGYPYNAYTQSSTILNEDLKTVENALKAVYNKEEE